MTVTDNEPGATSAPDEHTQAWVPTGQLVPHPDNPRRTLGDLSELTRSVKAHGVLMPLLVLPADEAGTHLIVAGHRRHAAAIAAELGQIPVIVRAMTPVEVVEAMLIENEHRGDLTIAEQIDAVERLMSMSNGLTPTKLNKRIGKSKAWVRTRMALTVVPPVWRERIDAGDLSLAAAEAATTVADLGPDHLTSVLDRLVDAGAWQDPNRVVEAYRRDLERDAAYEAAVRQARCRKDFVVFTADDPAPAGSKPVRDLFDAKELADAHCGQPCHGTFLRRVSWGDGVELVDLCVTPRNHRPAEATAEGAIVSDRPGGRSGTSDDSTAKRKGRVARTSHLAEVFGRSRGGPNRSELTTLALRALVLAVGQEPIKYAATVLGVDAGDRQRETLLALVDESPARLARVAAAIACGVAEGHMYWSPTSESCRDYLALLCDTGWTPDDWTASHLQERATVSG